MKFSSIFIAFTRSEKVIGKWLMIGEIDDWAIIPYWEEHEQCKALVNMFGLFQAQSMSLGGSCSSREILQCSPLFKLDSSSSAI